MNLPTFVDIKVRLFESLEWAVSTLRKSAANPATVLCHGDDSRVNPPGNSQYLWVYASTIGELNVLTTLLAGLRALYPATGLVILTDHPHYREAFRHKYPDATVVSHGENGAGIQILFAAFPPLMLLITEIPMLMYDAPCRLSFKVLHYCKQYGGRIFLVNGWLYGEKPNCTMDKLENSLFTADYAEIIDAYMIQQAEDLVHLKAAGIRTDKLHVTGNLKFDNLLSQQSCALSNADIYEGERTLLVCGCVTNLSEQQLVLETYQRLKPHFPRLLCVLAPRHPENTDRMHLLRTMLNEAGLTCVQRTAQQHPLANDIDLLILDTLGELQDFYHLGDICYVGLNHNLLEPLSFLKPTYVTPGWDSRYPSFPVYKTLLDKNLIFEAETATSESLADIILTTRQQPDAGFGGLLLPKIKALSGTLDQDIDIIQASMSAGKIPHQF